MDTSLEEGIMPIKSLCGSWIREILYTKKSYLELLIAGMKKEQFPEWTKK